MQTFPRVSLWVRFDRLHWAAFSGSSGFDVPSNCFETFWDLSCNVVKVFDSAVEINVQEPLGDIESL